MGIARKLRLFARAPDRPGAALYAAIVAEARSPAWYLDARLPDTVDGRFDAVALTTSLAILRLQTLGAREAEAALVDRFADDMDASFRELGVGDLTVGKAVGGAVSALGGRLEAYGEALAPDAATSALEAALVRNLYRGKAPLEGALPRAVAMTRALHARFGKAGSDEMKEGRW